MTEPAAPPPSAIRFHCPKCHHEAAVVLPINGRWECPPCPKCSATPGLLVTMEAT
jgi:hypothetical protein